jgi:DNA mismatch repair protein MutS2
VDGLFVDLGDEQSIEQETSTFAGHLRNIALAWKESTARSLTLFDELGGGTDPDEAALGRALLELLTERADSCWRRPTCRG